MKIGIITTWFERGAAYVSRQFKDELEKTNEVYIYARGGESFAKGDCNWDGPNVKWGINPSSYAPTDINIPDLKSWLLDNQIELILFNEQILWEPVLIIKKMNIKVGTYVDYYTESSMPLFALYDFLICNTKKHFSAFDWHPGALYFSWGTDLVLYKPSHYELVEPGILTFFHSAGMSPYRKGTDLLIKAYVQLACSKSKLLIHSQVKLSDSFPELAPVINKLIAEKRLKIIEDTVAAPGLYYLGDVYVYPTRLEGIGLTIAEASASGMPIIVPNNGPMNEFVDCDVSGQVVEIAKLWCRKDAYYWPQCEVVLTSLTEKMKYYIDNMDQIEPIKLEARKYAEKHLSWSINTASLGRALANVKIQETVNYKNLFILAAESDSRLRANRKMSILAKLSGNLENKFPALHVKLKHILKKSN